jgi:hypothetical protein
MSTGGYPDAGHPFVFRCRGDGMMEGDCVASVLDPGDPFRDWLVGVVKNRIRNRDCSVTVTPIRPASHTVCRFDFDGEKYAVVGKFFAEPTGTFTEYNAAGAMENEYRILKRVSRIILTPRPLARRRDFSCVLLSEFVKGRRLSGRLDDGRLYDHLTGVARLHRCLHDHTAGGYRKEREFATFQRVLEQAGLGRENREECKMLLGRWWDHPLLDRASGCMIHRDATPANYLVRHGRVHALDFESAWSDAHPVHDAGIFCAELKHYFAAQKQSGRMAEPYIGHYLWEYSHDEDDFREVCAVLPFFMALGYLRMIRVAGDNSRKRERLIREVVRCLRSKA